MSAPRISIMLPFLNGGAAFAVALRSIQQQTFEDWELLLCDDGSTDGSLEVARSFDDPRFVIWSDGKTKGLAARLNECIDRARGAFIARMDADDISYPDRLRLQLEFLEQHAEIDVVGCRMLVCGEEGQALGKRPLPLEHDAIVATPALGFGLAHPTWMARAAWYRRHQYDATALRFEDAELLYRAYGHSRFANLPQVLYGYRELRGGFQKRFKTRIGRMRYLKARTSVFGFGVFARTVAAESVRIVLDTGIALFSARYAMLRIREEALTAAESSEWAGLSQRLESRRARIVVITTVPQTMAAFFPKQLRELAENGFEVHAVSSPGEALDTLGSSEIITHALPMARRPDLLRDAVSLVNLFRLLRQLSPSIVHAHTPKAGLLGMLAAKAAGVPVRLYTFHGLPLMTRTGWWRRVLESVERTSAAFSTRAFCVSESLRREVITLKLCAEEKVSVVGHGSCAGVDVKRFRPAQDAAANRAHVRASLGIPHDATLVTFVGRIAKDKGFAVLAEAWSALARRSSNVCLLVAGEEDATDPVPVGVLEQLRGQASVFWAGSVPYDKVPQILSATDIAVLPTFREGLSQVALEAGAMGVPIVASNVCGLDAVQHQQTGLLVPARDPSALAQAILLLEARPELRRQLGDAAVEYVRSKFSDERVNPLWIAEYRALMGLPSPAPQRKQAVAAR